MTVTPPFMRCIWLLLKTPASSSPASPLFFFTPYDMHGIFVFSYIQIFRASSEDWFKKKKLGRGLV